MGNKNVLNMVLIAICATILNISKLALAFLPNIEPVSLLLIIYTLVLGFKRSILISLLFIVGEALVIWGVNLYVLQYLFVWPLLVTLTHLFKKILKENFFLWAIFSGAYGMLFGTLCSIPLIIFDKSFALSSIITGLPFDAIHLVGNYFLMLFLGEIIYKYFKTMTERLNLNGGTYENLY